MLPRQTNLKIHLLSIGGGVLPSICSAYTSTHLEHRLEKFFFSLVSPGYLLSHFLPFMMILHCLPRLPLPPRCSGHWQSKHFSLKCLNIKRKWAFPGTRSQLDVPIAWPTFSTTSNERMALRLGIIPETCQMNCTHTHTLKKITFYFLLLQFFFLSFCIFKSLRKFSLAKREC